MDSKFKPMKASDASRNIESIFREDRDFMASPKFDGLRGVVGSDCVLSNSLKPLPNAFIQETLMQDPNLLGLDGELIVGSPTAPNSYTASMSGVMSQGGTPDFKFYVFDWAGDHTLAWRHRAREAQRIILSSPIRHRLEWVDHVPVPNPRVLVLQEENYCQLGYEGLMLRDANGRYKFGRSSLREGKLLKVKRFVDTEGEVVGYQELLHNDNAQTTNELGYTARSSHKANLVPMGTLGSLVIKCPEFEETFNIGTGFTAAQRSELWRVREGLKGLIVKFKYLPIGVKDRPRHPVFLGFRRPEDMSE